MNPASISNMSRRDIPEEMRRRNVERQQRREAVARFVAVCDALVLLLFVVVYCFTLKAFIR